MKGRWNVELLPVPAGVGWLGPVDWSPDGSQLVIGCCRQCTKATSPLGKETKQDQHLHRVPAAGGTAPVDRGSERLLGQFAGGEG